jgi:putative Mg2+ transporter-C (MgtC) family protein
MPGLTPEMIEIFKKITLTIFLCGFIGFEREMRHKDAGLRTHILVGVGSALVVLTSFHVFNIYNKLTPIDPTRMIAGVITGLGFLCGGTIIRSGSQVSGLTTAATLWIVSCLGIAVGAGQYFAATVFTAITVIVLVGVRLFEKTMKYKEL